MKVLVTGTHFTPAQATIEELLKNPSMEVTYIGRGSTREGDKSPSVESQILSDLNVKFIPLISGRLQRSVTLYTIPSLLKIPIGLIQAFVILLREKPDVVLSFGGYISVPVVICAWLLSIPIILHEQTLVRGLASQINSLFANKIALSFPLKDNDDKKIILTGNPFRKEMLDNYPKIDHEYEDFLRAAKKEKLPLILVTGGNQGSHVINQTIGEIIPELNQKAFVIHQTGDSKFGDFEKLTDLSQNLKFKKRYLVKKWIEGKDMANIFREVDLVICRAGINTLLELAYFGIPALAIPLPYLYKDEQTVNSKYFANLGLAEVLAQKDLNSKNLMEKIRQMLSSLEKKKTSIKEAKKVVIPDAAKRLALETTLLIEK